MSKIKTLNIKRLQNDLFLFRRQCSFTYEYWQMPKAGFNERERKRIVKRAKKKIQAIDELLKFFPNESK